MSPAISSLGERVYEAIKEAINSLRIQPGQVISIGNLAEQLGTSRTPVRDALLRLQQDGLVTMMPNKAARVTEVLAKDVEEIFELRILLEGHAARVATTQLTAAEHDEIQSVLHQSKQAFENRQYALAAELGHQFHDLIIKKIDNRRMRAYLDDLDTHYTRIRRVSTVIPGRFKKSHQQHGRIIEALRAGVPEKAEQAMADHLASVCADILANMESLATSGTTVEAAQIVLPK